MKHKHVTRRANNRMTRQEVVGQDERQYTASGGTNKAERKKERKQERIKVGNRFF
jgi:hypothetical protein